MAEKLACYECKHRGELVGDAHSCCNHPVASKALADPRGGVVAMLAAVGRAGPVVSSGAQKLNIRANAHGVRSGWFNWPWNFDPVWLENCDGFEAKEKADVRSPE